MDIIVNHFEVSPGVTVATCIRPGEAGHSSKLMRSNSPSERARQ